MSTKLNITAPKKLKITAEKPKIGKVKIKPRLRQGPKLPPPPNITDNEKTIEEDGVEAVVQEEVDIIEGYVVNQSKYEELNRRGLEHQWENNPGFYFCVYFQTEEQKNKFLAEMGWLPLGVMYINGLELAEANDIQLETIPLKIKNSIRTGYDEESLPLPETK